MAFFRLSNIRRPSLTASSIEEKSSFSKTSSEASRATSVPLPPIAIPIWADFKAGASLTPSPVIATISPFALRASTIRSFCSGTTLAKMFTGFMRSSSTSSSMASSSSPVIYLSLIHISEPTRLGMISYAVFCLKKKKQKRKKNKKQQKNKKKNKNKKKKKKKK